MTLQPAPGAGVVRRDAHTIPPREPRDGRRIGTPISAEEPEFYQLVVREGQDGLLRLENIYRRGEP